METIETMEDYGSLEDSYMVEAASTKTPTPIEQVFCTVTKDTQTCRQAGMHRHTHIFYIHFARTFLMEAFDEDRARSKQSL